MLLESKVAQYQGASEQEKNVLTWLNNKAREIITDTSKHLKYVSHVFEEFDIHDVEHSEGVLEIMENLLGDNAKDLSSYDIFSLIAVSYLHDCGMAISDFEMEVLKMVEGKLDGKKPVAMVTAKQMITDNLDTIYGHDKRCFRGEIQKWLFVPVEEETLINYYAELLIGYQNFRNGRIDKIKASDDLDKTNKDLRIEYLRITHHERVEKYLINWGETKLADFPIAGMGQRLANNLAKCCRAHGEDADYMTNELKNTTRTMYYGSERSNLQFVAMMLRLGDIIHFSFDRAHPVLRALHHFKSDFSYQQWLIKANGLSFNVSVNSVSCGAYCQSPKDFYNLWIYVDYIDRELKLYNGLASRDDWGDYPKCFNEKVDRSNISHAPNFTPALGHKFSLDQNKVLELLTGAKLYSNEYACLRELYQNSLDACRFQIAKDAAAGRPSKGYIEFGLGEEKRNGNNRKYVYCLDNGKGMTKNIIENYLLHIGSSYYKSSDFFKKQAETGSTFTPTSQFGIGLLSCFMIGDEIEITTHEEGSKDGIISCVMEGTSEYIYYKTPAREDAEKVPNSGTLVKVFLNKKYKKLLNDDPLEKLGYLLWYKGNFLFRSVSIKNDKDKWEHHLYQIMNEYILMVHKDIKVYISLQSPKDGRESIKIYNKPLPIAGELKAYAILNNEFDEKIRSRFNELKNGDYLDISEEENGLVCGMVINTCEAGYGDGIYLTGNRRYCVDGIGVKTNGGIVSKIIPPLIRNGVILNFTGEKRPQLSVSRDDFINKSLNDFNHEAEALLEKLIKKSITCLCKYLLEKGISPEEHLYREIWRRLFNTFNFCYALLYECLKDKTECFALRVPLRHAMTFGELLNVKESIINKNMLEENRRHVNNLFLLRLLESKSIGIKDESELVASDYSEKIYAHCMDIERLLFHPLGYDDYWQDYDAVCFAKLVFISDLLNSSLCNYIKDVAVDTNAILHDNWIYSRQIYVVRRYLRVDIKHGLRANLMRISEDKTIGFVVESSIYGPLSNPVIKTKVPYYSNINYIGLAVYVDDFTVLAVSEQKSNRSICFAKRGRCTRQGLLDSITNEWRNKIKNVFFLDGTVWNANSSN